ncbi:MAG: mprF [Gemmatimonadetes bacterium]|nr:mprF [Gemmatimonadota bacterium]
MKRLRWLSPALGVLLFAAALWVLRRELQGISYRRVRATLAALPPSALAWSLLFAAANYAVLTGFDNLAFRYVGRKVRWWKVALVSFTGYAISNSVGFALISGTSVRYRFYSRWGLTAAEISRVVVFYVGTFWIGLLVLGGWSLGFDPHPALLRLPGGGAVRILGLLMLAAAAGYAVLAAVRRAPFRLRGTEVALPPAPVVAGQFVLSCLDWALAAGVFYVLLPPTRLTFTQFLTAFLAAQVLGLLSHVPGGAGVFEGAMVLLLRPYLSPEHILSSLVLYRIVYYLLPLAAALAVLTVDEVRIRGHGLARWGSAFGALSLQLAPKVLAVFVFLAGSVLLFSGATPTERARIYLLSRYVPLAVIEASYFLGSIVGVGLLVASNGVARRLDGAFYVAAVLLLAGVATSLLKGVDWEEALLLSLLLGALVPSRAAFDRRTTFWEGRFSPGWIVGVVSVLGASVWLGAFAFKHVEYSDELWWRFAAEADAPRFLRATVGATVAVLAFGVLRMLRPAPAEIHLPGEADLADAEAIIARQGSTVPFLVWLRDKTVLFNEARTAFLMYGVQGKTWVVMGDPVGGTPAEAAALIRAFFERCDDYGGVPVFYQVRKERLHQYADFGLTFVKLGEEAFVGLPDFTLDGADRKPFRLALNRFARAGLAFRIVEGEETERLMPQLRAVSDDWLAQKEASEKGFSLGFFDEAYVRRFPVAVVEEEGRVAAFATVWPGPDHTELSVDLMRYREPGPRNVMEALLLHLMLWGREQGYQRFNLGMAPLSGLEISAISPTWTRVGHFLFHRGERLYSFQGLRQYKEKFHPDWEPRYLAYPGGLALPRVTADVSALIAGGYRRIFRRRSHA